jgi:hypothetical protein
MSDPRNTAAPVIEETIQVVPPFVVRTNWMFEPLIPQQTVSLTAENTMSGFGDAATSRPIVMPSSTDERKCMPPYIRALIVSVTISLMLLNECCVPVTLLVSVRGTIDVDRSSGTCSHLKFRLRNDGNS